MKKGIEIPKPQNNNTDRKQQEKQMLTAIKQRNIPNVKLETDENGNTLIDKDKHPDLYEWARNG